MLDKAESYGHSHSSVSGQRRVHKEIKTIELIFDKLLRPPSSLLNGPAALNMNTIIRNSLFLWKSPKFTRPVQPRLSATYIWRFFCLNSYRERKGRMVIFCQFSTFADMYLNGLMSRSSKLLSTKKEPTLTFSDFSKADYSFFLTYNLRPHLHVGRPTAVPSRVIRHILKAFRFFAKNGASLVKQKVLDLVKTSVSPIPMEIKVEARRCRPNQSCCCCNSFLKYNPNIKIIVIFTPS